MTRMLIVHTCIMSSHYQRSGIVHLDGLSSKIFSSFGGFCPPWFLSFGAVVLWCYCPFWLFSVRPHDRHDENVDRPHLYHVITWPEMGSYTLMVGVLKYFIFWGFCPPWFFMLWGCYPMVLLSIMAFLCLPTWPHDENVDRPHLYHVITLPEIWLYTLMVGVVQYFHLLGVLSALIFILWGCCPMVLLSILALLCLPTWPAWREY